MAKAICYAIPADTRSVAKAISTPTQCSPRRTGPLLGRCGRVGCIVPSGIATDNTTKEFFASLIGTNTLMSLYDFENAVGLFEGVGHGRFKFCLLTIAGSKLPAG